MNADHRKYKSTKWPTRGNLHLMRTIDILPCISLYQEEVGAIYCDNKELEWKYQLARSLITFRQKSHE